MYILGGILMKEKYEKRLALLGLMPFIVLVVAFLFGPLLTMIIMSIQKLL